MGSWQEYVDEHLMQELPSAPAGRTLLSGAIMGLDGGIWASSENFPEMSHEEADVLAQGFDNPDILQNKGIRIASQKYISIQGVPGSVIRCKGFELKATGFTAMKCNQCIVMGLYGEGVQPNECNKVVEDFGDYLIELEF
ncbi:hypothetical protein BSKO_01585 [Bryopsis sp. KO-2023]|nr:hypothetical protein BSKO_01585 [Bryopsis sp. KO-2023]